MIAGVLHTFAGLLSVVLQIAAVIALAAPTAPLLMSLDGSCIAAAISSWVLPWSTPDVVRRARDDVLVRDVDERDRAAAEVEPPDTYGDLSYLVDEVLLLGGRGLERVPLVVLRLDAART